MDIAFIAIGNELLNGKIQDKNAFFLAKVCTQNAHTLKAAHLIADSYEEFERVLNLYQNSKTVVVISGGLGPTKDDMTKNYLSKYFDAPLEFNKNALKIVEDNYKQKQRVYNKEYQYEFIPAYFSAVPNERGFAPGLKLESQNVSILSLPGVPREFNQMVEELLHNEHSNLESHLIFKTKGLGETKIFHEMEPQLWDKLNSYGEVASLPHTMSVDISIRLNKISDEEKVHNLLTQSSIAPFIWHIGRESLEEMIIKKAKEKNIRFAFAESCTGGLLASRITDISGSSAVFYGSICAYDNSVKEKILNVQSHTLKEHGAVSIQCAKEMATGARLALGVDLVISTTGIAGPGGASKEKPVGTICIAASSASVTNASRYQFTGNRIDLKERFSQQALFTLFDLIESY